MHAYRSVCPCTDLDAVTSIVLLEPDRTTPKSVKIIPDKLVERKDSSQDVCMYTCRSTMCVDG